MLSVRLFELCTVALRVACRGLKVMYRCVCRTALPVYFFCIVQPQHTANKRIAEISASGIADHGQCGQVIILDAAFWAVRFCSYTVRRTLYALRSAIGLFSDSYTYCLCGIWTAHTELSLLPRDAL